MLKWYMVIISFYKGNFRKPFGFNNARIFRRSENQIRFDVFGKILQPVFAHYA